MIKAISIDRNTYEISNDGELVGILIYDSPLKTKATIRLPGYEAYVIEANSGLGTTIHVKGEEGEVAELKLTWAGQISIKFHDLVEYSVKARGFMSNYFTILDKDKLEVIRLNPKFDWKTFKYNFEIVDNTGVNNPLLLLISLYTCYYMMAMMSNGSTS